MNIVRPTLVLNKTICIQNIELMNEKAKRHNLKFRPHFKTHQSIEIGRWFREIGVKCITVSSVRMAQYFANDGWDDITIAFPFNSLELDDLNKLCKHASINIVADNIDTIEKINGGLKYKTGIFIKITTGFNRVGIANTALDKINLLISSISKVKNLQFKGFISHSGHAYEAKSRNEVQNVQFDTVQKMNKLKTLFIKRYPEIQISIGDTPTCSVSEHFNNIDEIRPGNFVFFDLTQNSLGACNIDDIAVRVHCPVVSKQSNRNEIVIYGGAIHFSKDWIENIDGKPLFGRIVISKNDEKKLLSNNYYLCRMSQEHGILKVPPSICKHIEIGDIIEIIPVHSCLTAQAMGFYLTTKGEKITMMSAY